MDQEILKTTQLQKRPTAVAQLLRDKTVVARLDHLVVDKSILNLGDRKNSRSRRVSPAAAAEAEEGKQGEDELPTYHHLDGATPPPTDLLDQFIARYKMYWLSQTFVEPEMEREFCLFLNRISLSSNRVLMIVILVLQVLTSFPYMLTDTMMGFKPLEFAVTGTVTFTLVVAIIISFACHKHFLDKWYLLLIRIMVVQVVFLIFGVGQYINSNLRLSSKTNFDPHVWQGYVVVLFMSTYLVKQ
ncbi:hypothetical protein HDU67_001115, partial [Dinochytrium kinnereticum]